MAMEPDSQAVFPFVIVGGSGASSGVFVYDPAVALGDLIASMTDSLTGPLGEATVQGVASYQEVGGTPGLVTQIFNGLINFLDKQSPDTVTHTSSAGVIHASAAGQAPITFVDSPSTDAGGLHGSVWLIGKPTGAGNPRVLLWNGVNNTAFDAQIAGVLQFCTVSGGVAVAANGMQLGPASEFQINSALLVNVSPAQNVFEVQLAADTNFRLFMDSNGKITWGTGAAVGDTDLYRAAVAVLQTDGSFRAAAKLLVGATSPVTTAQAEVQAAAGVTALELIPTAAGNQVVAARLSADTNDRLTIDGNGGHSWGSGAAATDCGLSRAAANKMNFSTCDVDIGTVGRGLQIKEGTNARQGTSVLVAGSVVVANTSVTSNTRIYVGQRTPGGTVGAPFVSSVTNGTGFTIKSTSATDTSTVAWLLVESG